MRGPLKQTKVTSSDVGVSPDMLRERPCSKMSRKSLSFESKSKSFQNVYLTTFIDRLIKLALCPTDSPPLLLDTSPVPLDSRGKYLYNYMNLILL